MDKLKMRVWLVSSRGRESALPPPAGARTLRA
jgi:hypothetical protein